MRSLTGPSNVSSPSAAKKARTPSTRSNRARKAHRPSRCEPRAVGGRRENYWRPRLPEMTPLVRDDTRRTRGQERKPQSGSRARSRSNGMNQSSGARSMPSDSGSGRNKVSTSWSWNNLGKSSRSPEISQTAGIVFTYSSVAFARQTSATDLPHYRTSPGYDSPRRGHCASAVTKVRHQCVIHCSMSGCRLIAHLVSLALSR